MATQHRQSITDDSNPAETFVWVDAWQQQCCGKEFHVGSDVTWHVRSMEDNDWVETILGNEWGDKVTFAEEHHNEKVVDSLSGTVRSIQVVTCERRLEPVGGERMWNPIPGTGKLHPVESADPWEPDTKDPHHTFDGWIVGIKAKAVPTASAA